MTKRLAIITLGCKTNQFESAAMVEQLTAAGYQIVPFTQQADMYLINSCTVTAATDAETRRLIRRARRLNPQARIVATGCYAQIAPAELEKLPELDCVVGNREKRDITRFMEEGAGEVTPFAPHDQSQPLQLSTFAEHTRAFLQIQNGCDSFCSYCIIPYARGRSCSAPPDQVVGAIERLAANGYQEVVLTGIHLGAYGLDLSPRTGLTELVTHIDRQGLVPRLRIGSLEPNEVTDELIELMAHSTGICPHLHLPLQSGSDTVLKRMGRGYDTKAYRRLIERLTYRIPGIFVGTDLIAGFPGETDDESGETLAFVQSLPLAALHVFPYSRRPGTKAARMPGHLSAQVIKERAARLRHCADTLSHTFLSGWVGKQVEVLVQEYDATTSTVKGISRNYLDVCFHGDESVLNREVMVQVNGISGTVLTGTMIGSISRKGAE